MKQKRVTYSDNFQKKYQYILIEPAGRNFDPEFTPELSPKEMLALGVFGGAYFIGVTGGIPSDIPKNWFTKAKMSPDMTKQKEYNYFDVRASQSLETWQKKGWIYKDDPHGWFQWYCRYYLGRRIPDEDKRQIRRWKSYKRHAAQVHKNCSYSDLTCRTKQRQSLLHWAYDSRKL